MTLEISNLHGLIENALLQLNKMDKVRFSRQLARIERLLLILYRSAVVAARREQEIGLAAQTWWETLSVLDQAARRLQSASAKGRGAGSLKRIRQLRLAASEMLDLYQ